MIGPNNYLKVSRGCSVVEMFLFNDEMTMSAAQAHRAALECLDQAMIAAAEAEREKTNPRAQREVVRMSLFKPCSCFEGVLCNHVGVWKCPKCLQSYEDCRC